MSLGVESGQNHTCGTLDHTCKPVGSPGVPHKWSVREGESTR